MKVDKQTQVEEKEIIEVIDLTDEVGAQGGTSDRTMGRRNEWTIMDNGNTDTKNSKNLRTPNDIEKHIKRYFEREAIRAKWGLEAVKKAFEAKKEAEKKKEEEKSKTEAGLAKIGLQIIETQQQIQNLNQEIKNLETELTEEKPREETELTEEKPREETENTNKEVEGLKKTTTEKKKLRIIKDERLNGKNRIPIKIQNVKEQKEETKEEDGEIQITFSKINKIPAAKYAWIYSLGRISEWNSGEEDETEKKRTWRDERKRTLQTRKQEEEVIFGGIISDDEEGVPVKQSMVYNKDPLDLTISISNGFYERKITRLMSSAENDSHSHSVMHWQRKN